MCENCGLVGQLEICLVGFLLTIPHIWVIIQCTTGYKTMAKSILSIGGFYHWPVYWKLESFFSRHLKLNNYIMHLLFFFIDPKKLCCQVVDKTNFVIAADNAFFNQKVLIFF